jgi:predicted RNA-binding Zn ribbon-like protein
MAFTHDTELSLSATAALVNTGRAAVDEMPDVAALDAFIAHWQWSGSRTHEQAELADVLALRTRLARLWEMTADEAAVLVNTLLADANALPQLVKHDGWDYHIHATSPDAPLADRMAVDAAMAIADVIRVGEFGRLRVCAADDCEDVVVDLSKNRSRRFCSLTCANRVNVAAYRSRRTASSEPAG